MKILIATGIYPPQIGGPAQYAKKLSETLKESGHRVAIKTYGAIEHSLPSGLRHLFFFFKIIPAIFTSNIIFALDTMSAGFPVVLAGTFFGKKVVIRTGGDFLWEQYVERTKKKVLFRDFYKTEIKSLSLRENLIFKCTKWTLRRAAKIVFSTDWQRKIFIDAHSLDFQKTAIVENYYGPKESDSSSTAKIFIASTRDLIWKNKDTLKSAFKEVKKTHSDIKLFTDELPYDDFLEKMRSAYAVILVSLGDISPNMILDAIRLNKPFICTREIGIYDRIQSCGIYVNPLDNSVIAEAVIKLLNPRIYRQEAEKIKRFTFIHSWRNIANELMAIAQKK